MLGLRNLIQTYPRFQPSDKCYLSSKYIRDVLPDIQSLELIVHENDNEWRGDVRSENSLVHLRISYNGDKHANLLIIEGDKVYRFEPLSDDRIPPGLDDVINDAISDFFPHHRLFVLNAHPQQHCENKGMCVAYVIKVGVLYLLDEEIDFGPDAEDDIKRFASAVEALRL